MSAAHEAVSAYLAAAPRGLRSWARAQAAGADEAYALLTDPAALARAVALVGAGARSAVLPGGPATPPVHRDSPVPAAAAAVPAAAVLPAGAPGVAKPRYDENGRRVVSDDEIDALLAEVDPAAPRDVVGTAAQRAASLAAVQPVTAPRGNRLGNLLASRAFRNLALVGATVAAIGIVAVVGYGFGGSGSQGIGANPGASASPAASAPVLDQAKVAGLMAKIQANPKDADTLMALGDEYYKVGDFATAGNWFTKVTVVEPAKVRGFLALGATAFNGGDMNAAEVAWRKVLDIDEKNVEAHYDLGFLYFNRQPPDMAAVQLHWNRVVELDPDSEIATDGEGPPRRPRQHGPGVAGALRLPRRVPGGEHGARRLPGPEPGSLRGAIRDPAAMTVGAGIGLVVAFLAGVVSFASPCCLPLVPAYIGYMVGATGEADRRRSFFHGLAFVAGFTLVFVAFWASIGAIGYVLADNAKYLRDDRRRGPHRLRPPGRRRHQPAGPVARHAPHAGLRRRGDGRPGARRRDRDPRRRPGRGRALGAPGYGRSLLFGVVFAAGWSPCIGPILGGIIGLASSTASVAQGTVLLLAYAAGLAVPFLAVAMGATWVARRLGWVGRHHRAVSLVSGAMLVVLGILMVTNLLARLAAFTAPLGG